MYLLLLHHWGKHFPTVSQIWEEHLEAFIEEDGELSFSVLSRTVLADSSKSSFETLNRAYSGQHMYKEAMADLDTDLHCFTRSSSLHTLLDQYSDEVAQLGNFLQLHYESLQTESFKIYKPLDKGATAYLNPAQQDPQSLWLFLSPQQLQEQPALNLKIQELEPPSLIQRLEETLNTVEQTLSVNNLSGIEVKYILFPEDLVSEASSAGEEDEVL